MALQGRCADSGDTHPEANVVQKVSGILHCYIHRMHVVTSQAYHTKGVCFRGMSWRRLRPSIHPHGLSRAHCRGQSSKNHRSVSRLYGCHPSTRSYGGVTRHSTLLSKERSADIVQNVTVAGLVRSIRKQKKIAFAHISDGTTLAPIQAILQPTQADGITNGAFVRLSGEWASSAGQGQSHELQVKQVKAIGTTIPEDFPIQKKAQSPDYLRSIPHLRFRTPFYSLLARARSQLTSGVHSYYAAPANKGDYVQVHPPLITSSDCEGAGEVFTIAPKSSAPIPEPTSDSSQHLYFRDPKYLTVSSQLHLEAYSAELGNVWALSPTFRAEESETPRHLSEFYMLEAEMRDMSSLKELMCESKSLIKHLATSLASSRCGKELQEYYSDARFGSTDDGTKIDLVARWDSVLSKKWHTLTYAEAIASLKAYSDKHPGQFAHAPNYDTGLQLEHERWLVSHIAEESPLFVTHYPKNLKPFYMLPSDMITDENSSTGADTVACFDLLLPYGSAEVIGGSLREHRLENLIQAMREKGLIKTLPDPPVPLNNKCNQHESRSSQEQQEQLTHIQPPSESPPPYPFLNPNESLGSLQWYTDLRRFGSSPHGGFGLGFDRLLAYLTGVASIRDTVGFPRYFGRADC